MRKNLSNGNFQTAAATIAAVILVSFVPELEPLQEHLFEIILVIIGALVGNGLRARSGGIG